MSEAIQFNFSGFIDIFNETIENNERTLAFQIENGRGKFVFMAFFDKKKTIKNKKESINFDNKLFIYCRNIRFMANLKLYGNPKKGSFSVYISEFVKNKIIEELQLQMSTGTQFDFNQFLNQLNLQIPKSIGRNQKVKILKDNLKKIDFEHSRKLVDESSKIYLCGTQKVADGKNPRDKTLRKLFLYVDGITEDISSFIVELKKVNKTVCWSDNPNLEKDFMTVASSL